MKLLYILNVANRVNNFSYSSMRAALDLGIEFHIAGNWGYATTEDRLADEKKHGIKIHQVDFERFPLSPKNRVAYKQLLALMQREKYDAVHCNTPIGGVLGRICARKCGIEKILYQAHGFHFYKGAPLKNWLLYYPFEKMLAHDTDGVITITKEDYEFAKSKLRLRNRGNTYYVPGVGIDLGAIQYTLDIREKKRELFSFGECDTVLISVGELNQNKNNEVIIKALAKLQNPNIHYILCGVGEKKESLEAMVQKYGLDQNVRFLGYRTDVMDLYAASDIFVMPSFREGMSRAVMEAMAVGLPCVVSKIRGNTDMIDQNQGGFLCSPTDANESASAIETIVKDDELRSHMNKYNTEKVKAFDIGIVTEQIREIYLKELL